MDEKLVTIASFTTAPEAEFARNALETEGIRGYLADINAIEMKLGSALGFVKLQVSSNDCERAISLLKSLSHTAGDAPQTALIESNQCLSCGAAMAEDSDTCPVCGWSFRSSAERDAK